MKRRRLIVLLLFSLLSVTAWGQLPISNLRGISNQPLPSARTQNESHAHTPDSTAADSTAEEGPKGVEYHVDIPDSVLQASVFFFHRLQHQVKILELKHPTLSPTGVQFTDCLDAFNGNYYLPVTELGHPHLVLTPSFDNTPGLVYKSNIFPAFYKTPDNIHFYQVQNPYTLLSYNSSLDQDYQVHVTHTQNINERWNFALDYHLFSPEGVFSNSSATDHLFDFNTNYYSPDARYQISAGFIWQRMVLGENGGLSNEDTYINKRISNMGGIPVNHTQRMSNNTDHTVFVRQSFNTVRQFEWYRPIKESYVDTIAEYDTVKLQVYDTVAHDTVERDSVAVTYRYELRDTIIGYDTLQPYDPHVYNTGVLGLELQWDKQKYRCVDSTLYNRLTASLFWTNDAYMDHRWRNPLKIYGGVRPQMAWLAMSDSVYTRATVRRVMLYPFGRVEISPWPATELNVYAEAAPNLSEYNLDARLVFPFRDSVGNSKQNITLRAVVKALQPELIYTAQCLRTDSPVADDLKAIGIRKIEADYSHNKLLQVHLAAQHISHNVWFNQYTLADDKTALFPQQSDGSALLLQGRVNLNLTVFGWLHYDMQQHVQYSSDQEQIRVPLFASKNSIYADFKLFNNVLHTQVGTDIRYHTAYKADGYDPVMGAFYRQDEVEVGNYLWADFFINIQVKRASIYAKAAHINSFLEEHSYCILPHYPAKQFGFFFGMTWKFFD